MKPAATPTTEQEPALRPCAPRSSELSRRIHPADMRAEFRASYEEFLSEIKIIVLEEDPAY